MYTPPRRFALAVLAVMVAACAKHQPEDMTADLEGGVEIREGAIIISGVTLEDEMGSIIDALVGRVPNFKVTRNSGPCPQITLRSSVSFELPTDPQVYVDGTRIGDTCVLESLRAQNVALVEIYPMGFTTRPGYATHAHGLILVFLRTS
jgi:hypothetical protein